MTNLSDLFPAGAGKQVSFVASGTLSNGQAVALKTDGTVAAISAQVGAESVFDSNTTYLTATVYDSNSNKIVVTYGDGGNSFYGTAVVGTVSGTSISFGTAVVFQSLSTDEISAVYDSTNGKVVVSYREAASSLSGRAIVGTVSGTSISFGTETVFESGDTTYTSAVYDSTNGKVVIAYSDGGNGQYGTAIVGTVSGTSISFGTAAVFESADSNYISAAYDSTNNKVVISYQDDANSTFGTAVVGTVSGTSISFGTPVVFNAAGTYFVSSSFDDNANKVVISYRDSGNANYGTSIVGTVSGTSISFGTSVVFENALTNYISSTFDSNLNKVVIAYSDSGNSNHGTSVVGTVSGTSISFGNAVTFNAANTAYISATYDSTNNKVVIAYRDSGDGNKGTSVVFDVAGNPSSNFIGITDAAISSAASGNVTIKGGIAVNGLSSLTPGSDYYVQADGTISTVSTGSAVKIGRAMSATSINLEYQS